MYPYFKDKPVRARPVPPPAAPPPEHPGRLNGAILRCCMRPLSPAGGAPCHPAHSGAGGKSVHRIGPALPRVSAAAYEGLTHSGRAGQGNSQGQSMLRTSGVDPSNGPSFGGFPGAPQGQQGGGFPFSAGTPLGRSLILTRVAPAGG